MQEFKAVYFFVNGMEMCIPGATIEEEKVDYNHFIDTNVNKYGCVLYNKIQACDYVEKPLWFNKVRKNVQKLICISRNKGLKIESNNLEIHPLLPVCSSDNSSR